MSTHNIPRTVIELVEACRGKTREQVLAIVEEATDDFCPHDGTPEQALYQAIYEEGCRHDPSIDDDTCEPFRASMIAIGEHAKVQGMIDW